jgi:hypothetical protein
MFIVAIPGLDETEGSPRAADCAAGGTAAIRCATTVFHASPRCHSRMRSAEIRGDHSRLYHLPLVWEIQEDPQIPHEPQPDMMLVVGHRLPGLPSPSAHPSRYVEDALPCLHGTRCESSHASPVGTAVGIDLDSFASLRVWVELPLHACADPLAPEVLRIPMRDSRHAGHGSRAAPPCWMIWCAPKSHFWTLPSSSSGTTEWSHYGQHTYDSRVRRND